LDKLDLHRIDLVCIDSKHVDKSLDAINHTMSICDFQQMLFFTDCDIKNIDDYCRFVMCELHKHVISDFVLIIQHDGYVLNPKAWTDEFYDYDYIGAPWWYNEKNVGNGGFSLRSKKFLEESSRIANAVKIVGGNITPEDEVLCRNYYDWMVGRGIKFAPEQLAARFSLERNGKFGNVWNGQFGFHNNETNLDRYYNGNWEMYK
jgi:hypothetical protein